MRGDTTKYPKPNDLGAGWRIGIARPNLETDAPFHKNRNISERAYRSVMARRSCESLRGTVCTGSNQISPTNIPAPEMDTALTGCVEGDVVRLALDCDSGALTVHKNGERGGVAVRGLAGEFCWVVTLWDTGTRLRIARVA